jgi:uncharacterized phage protein gp47/JayE
VNSIASSRTQSGARARVGYRTERRAGPGQIYVSWHLRNKWSSLAALSATGIRQLAPGGKARAFGDIVANELAELENRQFANIAQSLLPFATDTSLDLLGEIYGVTRLPQTNATVDIGDQNFQWYVRNGTFGSINSGQAGVRVYTAAGTSGPVYIANAVTLPAAQSSMSFGATALYSGSAGNAAAGVFSLSNFTNYTESTYGSLLVTNNYGIVGGSDAETDDNYRYRRVASFKDVTELLIVVQGLACTVGAAGGASISAGRCGPRC